jgi:hypothetical protein
LCFSLVMLAIQAKAINEKFIEAMQKHILTVYTSESPEEIQNAINAFDRIGEAEKSKWEPFYYSSFGYIMMANREKEPAKKDSYLDQALSVLEKAKAIQPNESELIALEGFVHMIRVTVDPPSRGQQYSSMAFQSFSKAATLNPENPRALMLLAQMQYGTAQFFGSPTTEACGTLVKALQKFDTFKSDNPIAPQWGRKIAEGLKSKCN